MAEFKIFCNNTVDLPKEKLKELDVTAISLTVNIGSEAYKEIAIEELYTKMRAGAMPSTSAVNLGEGLEAFEPALQAGHDVLCLAFSSGLSVSYEALDMAGKELQEKYPDRKIVVIDTLNASAGEAIMVFEAVKMKNEGKSIEDVQAWVEENKHKVLYWFSVDDLNHLKRGGRISASKALIGSMLNVKPILTVDKIGKLQSFDKVRGRTKSFEFLVEKLKATVKNPKDTIVYIPHVDCAEDANRLGNMAKEQVGVKDAVAYPVGPVFAAHTGFGLVAFIYLGDGVRIDAEK